VVRQQEVRHLVKNDVVETIRSVLGKLQIEPNRSPLRITAAPLGSHTLNEKPIQCDPEPLLPFGDKVFCLPTQLDVSIDEVAHIRFVGLQIQHFATGAPDDFPDIQGTLDLLLYVANLRGRLHLIGEARISADKGRNGLIESSTTRDLGDSGTFLTRNSADYQKQSWK
jgi:hypothetical protein